MRKRVIFVTLFVSMLFTSAAYATNGDNLIGIGPITRAMGGVGIAAPQDAIGAVFANPAGMCFGPYCPGSEFNFAGTLFVPDVKASQGGSFFGGSTEADGHTQVYTVPAVGISVPITRDIPMLRFGLGAYGASGLGVDYRNQGLPAEVATQLQIMKFSPAIAYQPTERLSLGLGVHIDYASLDLSQGVSFNYGFGVELGVIYKLLDTVQVGLVYVSPQEVNHKNVADLDGNGTADDLKLEAPQQVGIGIAFQPMQGRLLLAADGRWVNWQDATGYRDFDWKDQYILALGAQYKVTPKFALRLGYNYGENQVRTHNGFDGTGTTNVQGVNVNTLNYEVLRITGFPAIVQHHVTAGVGYEFSNRFAVNLGYVHAFEEEIAQTGTVGAQTVTLASTLSEDSLEFGFTWRF